MGKYIGRLTIISFRSFYLVMFLVNPSLKKICVLTIIFLFIIFDHLKYLSLFNKYSLFINKTKVNLSNHNIWLLYVYVHHSGEYSMLICECLLPSKLIITRDKWKYVLNYVLIF